ncbi:hypothetical protein ACIPSA_32075 [Streptomyces sp. NPDC086549]|uniref:hypothetical protein n=1 Tax=Streptomyces sp. NPDC086549 TaxID=3365752 RepID=UPI003817D406
MTDGGRRTGHLLGAPSSVLKEGRDAWRGDACCAVPAATAAVEETDGCGCAPGCACCF